VKNEFENVSELSKSNPLRSAMTQLKRLFSDILNQRF